MFVLHFLWYSLYWGTLKEKKILRIEKYIKNILELPVTLYILLLLVVDLCRQIEIVMAFSWVKKKTLGFLILAMV